MTTTAVERDKKAPAAPPLEDSSRRLCVENPYQGSFLDSLDEIAQAADAWLDTLPDKCLEAFNNTAYGKYGPARFFPFLMTQ